MIGRAAAVQGGGAKVIVWKKNAHEAKIHSKIQPVRKPTINLTTILKISPVKSHDAIKMGTLYRRIINLLVTPRGSNSKIHLLENGAINTTLLV